MQLTKAFKRTYYGAGVLAAALSACASNPPSDPSQVAASAQALSVIDCQNKAAQCLGSLPNAEKIKSCRDEIKACVDQLQMDQEKAAKALSHCVADAASCAQDAETFGDAMTCRNGFEDCAAKVVDLTNLPLVPEFPMLPPAVGKALDGADKCRKEALSCVKAGGSPSEIASCADDYRGCVIDLLPAPEGARRPVLPNLSDSPVVKVADKAADLADKAEDCLDGLRACLKDSETRQDTQDCATEARKCIASKPKQP
jgi:hypothetical protein